MLSCDPWEKSQTQGMGKARAVDQVVLSIQHRFCRNKQCLTMPVLALVFRRRKRPVGTSWRLDETYIEVAGQWEYLYRAVDKTGGTVDFLLTAKRDMAAARRYLERAINLHGLPEKITIDKTSQSAIDWCTPVFLARRAHIDQEFERIENAFGTRLYRRIH